MYVCVCNALNERDVRAAKSAGATKVSEVFNFFGVRPQCGRCFESMRVILGTAADSSASQNDDATPSLVPERCTG